MKEIETPKTKNLLERVVNKHKHEKEFVAAFEELVVSVSPLLEKEPHYFAAVEYLSSPESIYQFKVSWEDDDGQIVHNNGFRVQHCNALGPYKGGLRFSASVTTSVMKFLAFEQTFKNALVGLPLGGAKGGADFEPRQHSRAETRRFCQAFARKLHSKGLLLPEGRADVPAGDIGVSNEEIGFLFGELRRLTGIVSYGSLTGKPEVLGGSVLRPEATGYGVCYALEKVCALLEADSFVGLRAVVTGAGNVALFCAEKLTALGVKVVSLSDSNGTLFAKGGTPFSGEELESIKSLRVLDKKRLPEVARLVGKTYAAGRKAWQIPDLVEKGFQLFLPCATEHEVGADEAARLLGAGVRFVAEGANMPCDKTASDLFVESADVYVPCKAANLGGVAVSALEMLQNRSGVSWSSEEVDRKLRRIVQDAVTNVYLTSCEFGVQRDLRVGTNIYALRKVAEALFSDGSLSL